MFNYEACGGYVGLREYEWVKVAYAPCQDSPLWSKYLKRDVYPKYDEEGKFLGYSSYYERFSFHESLEESLEDATTYELCEFHRDYTSVYMPQLLQDIEPICTTGE